MRIIGGDFKGFSLLKPPHSSRVRPTTDRVREGVASLALSAFNLDLSGVSVLDAFAGSGALGIEFLSRGAKHVTFIDVSKDQTNLVRSNLSALEKAFPHAAISDRAHLCLGHAKRLAQRAHLAGAPFSLVLLDPPYAFDPSLSAEVLFELAKTGKLTDTCLVIHEREKMRSTLLSEISGGSYAPFMKEWVVQSSKKYGTTIVDVLSR